MALAEGPPVQTKWGEDMGGTRAAYKERGRKQGPGWLWEREKNKSKAIKYSFGGLRLSSLLVAIGDTV